MTDLEQRIGEEIKRKKKRREKDKKRKEGEESGHGQISWPNSCRPPTSDLSLAVQLASLTTGKHRVWLEGPAAKMISRDMPTAEDPICCRTDRPSQGPKETTVGDKNIGGDGPPGAPRTSMVTAIPRQLAGFAAANHQGV